MTTQHTSEQIYDWQWYPAEVLGIRKVDHHIRSSRDRFEGAENWNALDRALALASHKNNPDRHRLFGEAFAGFAEITSKPMHNDVFDMDHMRSSLASAYRPAFAARFERRDITPEEVWQIHTDTLPITDRAIESLKNKKDFDNKAANLLHLVGREVISRAYDCTGFLPQALTPREYRGRYHGYITAENNLSFRLLFASERSAVPSYVFPLRIGNIAFNAWRQVRRTPTRLQALCYTHQAIKQEAATGEPTPLSPILEGITRSCLDLIDTNWRYYLD